MNKLAQLRELNDIIKSVVVGVIGLAFLSSLIPIVSSDIVKSFAELGGFIIVVAIITLFISLLFKPSRRY